MPLASSLPAFALNPDLDIRQYAHTAWRSREGFPKGTIASFAQTPDGYLWLGTSLGLVRFDGVRAVPWQAPAGAHLPDRRVRALLTARDGTLWIGTTAGLVAWKHDQLLSVPELADNNINALAEDRDGTVWIGAQTTATVTGRLCAARSGGVQCYGGDGSLGRVVDSVWADSRGNLWIETSDAIWRWKPGPVKLASLPEPAGGIRNLIDGGDGATLAITRQGIQRITENKIEAFAIPGLPTNEPVRALLADRNGALWIGMVNGGLLHLHRGHLDRFSPADGLSDNDVTRLFEDREGSVWVSTLNGLDRFREFTATTLSDRRGLTPVGAVTASRGGGVWISTLKGLYQWKAGVIYAYRAQHRPSQPATAGKTLAGETPEIIVKGLPEGAASLYEDRQGRLWIGSRSKIGYLQDGHFVSIPGVAGGSIDDFAEDKQGKTWALHRDLGLLHLTDAGVAERIDLQKLGIAPYFSRMAADPLRGGLWISSYTKGVFHVLGGQVHESFGSAEGLFQTGVRQLRVDGDGTIWAATQAGLTVVQGGRLTTLTAGDGLPCDWVDSFVEDEDGYWLSMACGIVKVARSDLQAWLAARPDGKGSHRHLKMVILDESDGVRSETLRGTLSPHIARDIDGRIWFTGPQGISVLDPRQMPSNRLAPPVHIEQITADRETYEAITNLRLPPLIRDLQIDYTALSLVAPEKNLFRYKLEGRDRDWQEAGNRRQAFYTDLAPGHYQFRVIAANNSGVWNEQGDLLHFSVAPAYWQTGWFRLLCLAVLLALLWLAHWLRTRHLTKQFHLTLEARVAERTRIARDLHDTLLQSFGGLVLHFQTALYQLPPNGVEAKKTLKQAIYLACEAITESREAVQRLRASVVETNDLATALKIFGDELLANRSGAQAPAFAVVVQGTVPALHPIMRDEIYWIGCEALRNAFEHAAASSIEVELRYDARQARLRLRDNGKGIDPAYLGEEGRAGHFGLHGMRERARLIGGKLTVWSALESGTEVELLVPGVRAYAASPAKAT